jgi:iron complex outermembrane receptor protein
MKTIYKSCYFYYCYFLLVFWLRILLVELFLIKHQDSPFRVNVNVQGSTNGVSTDFDGKFQLPNAKKGAKIVFLSLVTKHSH